MTVALAKGWILKGKNGKLFAETFQPDKASCWSESFITIENRHNGFRAAHWKQWDDSIKAAKKLGYTMVRAKVVELK